MKIHITGAPGSGTTTLGRSLAGKLEVKHFDTDDYYWQPSDPPYQKSREVEQRLDLLRADLSSAESWVLSGALEGWGDSLTQLFELVVFLQVPTEIRLLRLRHRERQRFGEEAISPGGSMYPRYKDFIHWAQTYDEGSENRRSRRQHEKWLSQLSCEVVQLNGSLPIDRQLERLLERIPRLIP